MLKTKKIFLDTQSIREAGYNFQRGDLAEFTALANQGEVEYISTFVVDKEIVSQLKAKAEEQIKSVKNIEKDALRCGIPSLVSSLGVSMDLLNKEKYIQSACLPYEQFKTDCNVQILRGEGIDIDSLFDAYIAGAAPFSSGKKKNEFPDAFSLKAIQKSLHKDEKIYIVSGDKDFKNAVKDSAQFIYLEKLSEFLDLYNRQNVLYQLVATAFNERRESLLKQLELDINGLTTESIAEDDSSMVLFHRVIEKNLGEIFVTSVSETTARVICELSYKVELEALVPSEFGCYKKACNDDERENYHESYQTVTDFLPFIFNFEFSFNDNTLKDVSVEIDFAASFPTGSYVFYIDRNGLAWPSPSAI